MYNRRIKGPTGYYSENSLKTSLSLQTSGYRTSLRFLEILQLATTLLANAHATSTKYLMLHCLLMLMLMLMLMLKRVFHQKIIHFPIKANIFVIRGVIITVS